LPYPPESDTVQLQQNHDTTASHVYSTQQQCKMVDVANIGTSKEWQLNFLLWTAPVWYRFIQVWAACEVRMPQL